MNTGTPTFKINKNFVLSGGVSFNILTQSDHCIAGRVFIAALICLF